MGSYFCTGTTRPSLACFFPRIASSSGGGRLPEKEALVCWPLFAPSLSRSFVSQLSLSLRGESFNYPKIFVFETRTHTHTHTHTHRRKREASGVPVGASRKYQSQAVGLVQDMIEWLVDKRMVEYDDESEWRRRSGLEPLPPPPKTSGGGGSKPAGAFGGSAGLRSPPPRGIFSAGSGGGGAADVINLLSDSMVEDDDDEDDDSFSEDEDF